MRNTSGEKETLSVEVWKEDIGPLYEWVKRSLLSGKDSYGNHPAEVKEFLFALFDAFLKAQD